MVEISGGRFDPTVGPLEKLWREHLKEKKAPPIDKFQAAVDATSWKHIAIRNGQFQKDNGDTTIDLCAISKGLCIDWILERLQKKGFKDLFVEWAGEIRTSGEHPEKRDWTVQVDPGLRMEGKSMAPLPLHNAAIATSGDYSQRGWTLPAEASSDHQVHRYFHIIDPFTGQPLEKTNYSIAAAVVIAPTCALADALATAAMLFPGRAEAEKWAEEVVELYPEVSFWILSYSK
jgi:thiamine biosynthesis lipoprotein